MVCIRFVAIILVLQVMRLFDSFAAPAAGPMEIQPPPIPRSTDGNSKAVYLKTTIVQIADRWVEGWLDKEWDETKGAFKLRQGPYSDAFEYHYVAAVLINTPESKFYRNGILQRCVVSDLLYHSGVFVEQCRDKGLRGYWALNNASDKGIPVGSGSWQSRSFIRACLLLDKSMTPEQQRAWREGTQWLIAALTVDWKETFGPWWSTNKVADHIAGVGQWLLVSHDPKAREFLERQSEWFWRAFPDEGCADKYHNYFAKTMYRLAPIMLAPEAKQYHGQFVKRMKMWRSFITPNGLYDGAEHPEPNSDEIWHGKLGPILCCLLLASPDDPELAAVAGFIVEQRLAGHQSDSFWRTQFDAYFGQHWGSLGLILETYPIWQKAFARNDVPDFEQMRFFDYWRGLGRVAVKTERYQASCYPHWAWTWDFATYGGVLFRLNTPGAFRLGDRAETGRCWLDWDTHRDPETGGERNGIVVATTRDGKKLSFPPNFPDEAIATGSPEGRLYGFTDCRYTLGDVLAVRTSNVFLNDTVVVLNTITALKDAAFESFYVQQPFANPGDLVAVASDGRTIEFEPENVKPKTSKAYPVSGPFDLRSRGGSGALAFVPLNAFAKQELVDIALFMQPKGDPKRIPHRVEVWRGHLPASMKKGDVLRADFAYVPHDAKTEPKTLAESFEVVATEIDRAIIVKGEPTVVIAARSVSESPDQRLSVAGFDRVGQLFAGEVAKDKVRKVCLYGESIIYRGEKVVGLSRPAVVTFLPEQRQGIVDAGFGPIDVATPQKTYHLFSANHEFPRMALILQTLNTTYATSAKSSLSDVSEACRNFISSPARIEEMARLAEIEMLMRSAQARTTKATDKRNLIAEAKKALAAGNLERARSLVAEAQRQVLAMHEEADREGKAVAPVSSQTAAAALFPPRVGGQGRYETNYLISFHEEKARNAAKRRAEELICSAEKQPDAPAFSAAIRNTEQILLSRYFGLPIHWTREHIPGQPDFFWRPFMESESGKAEGAKTDWEQALLKYLHPTDRQWLAVRRIEAAAELIQQ